jgi:hypothetical protein
MPAKKIIPIFCLQKTNIGKPLCQIKPSLAVIVPFQNVSDTLPSIQDGCYKKIIPIFCLQKTNIGDIWKQVAVIKQYIHHI